MSAIIPADSPDRKTPEKNIAFRWTYIVLPVVVFVLSMVLAAGFYHRLPAGVAYHFEDGAPDRWMGRGAVIAWMIAPQFVFALFALIITSVAAWLGARMRLADSISTRKVLFIMGNMVALPQIILAFAMLDIFLYNAYRIHLMPLWIFAVMVMVVGGVILGVSLMQAVRQSHRLPGKSLKE